MGDSEKKPCNTCRWYTPRIDEEITIDDCCCFHAPFFGIGPVEFRAGRECTLHWPGPHWMTWRMRSYPDGSPVAVLLVDSEHCQTQCRQYAHPLFPCKGVGPCVWPKAAGREEMRQWASKPEYIPE